MNSNRTILAAILVSAIITFALRAMPFWIFSGGKKMPSRLERLGKNLPSAIMAVLIVYCLKDVAGDFSACGLRELAAAALVIVTYKWKHNILLSIFLGTVCNMVLIRII